MDRRTLLKHVAVIPLCAGLATPTLAAVSGSRRVRPGEPGWPREADWDALNRAVGGQLVKPVSVYGACETRGGQAGCLAEAKRLKNPFYLGDQAGGTQVSGWLNAWTPKPSAWAVAARSAADVAIAVNFAREHRLRLVVKGGGHSYQGTSNAADSLLIWTRAMNAVELHDAFVPRDCEGVEAPQPAVSVGAGAMWIDAYDAVTTRAGRYVQGGGCTTVGVAGHIQSGGFGSWSKGFGLAAGNLLEAEVVTADGQIRIVNPRRDPGLFWAIKGGGGGSFGVVTRLTLRTHDLPEHFGWAEVTVKAASDEAFRRLIDRFAAFYAEALFNPHWGEQASVRPDNTLAITMASQGLDRDQAQEIWRPFLAWVAAAPRDYQTAAAPEVGAGLARGTWDVEARRRRGNTSMVADDRPGALSSHAWWNGDGEQVSMFLHGYESVWLPASLLRPDQRARLVEALFAASRHIDVGLHFNKGLAGAAPEALKQAADTAMNPAVLDAFALAIVATGGMPPLPGLPGPAPDMALARRNAEAVDLANAALLKVAPLAGSYVSESNYFNPNWSRAFWGRNYPRLQAVKARYDPGGLFFVHHGVGSEVWSADGFVRA
jgi:FAD/FMN-containing dehydrogenase